MPSPCHSEHDATGSPRSTTDTPDRLTSAPLYYRCAAAPMVRMGSPGPHRGHTRPEWHGQHRAMAATQHRSSAALLNQHHRSSDPSILSRTEAANTHLGPTSRTTVAVVWQTSCQGCGERHCPWLARGVSCLATGTADPTPTHRGVNPYAGSRAATTTTRSRVDQQLAPACPL